MVCVSAFPIVPACAAILLTATIPATAQESVTTSRDLGKLFSQSVDSYVYAQPLYVSNVTIGGVADNVVYVATEHDSVYAFDADANIGANAQPLWPSFLSSGVTTVSACVVNTQCSDINLEYGITGTPVIDLTTNTLYLVAETLENSGTSYLTKLHALDLTTGAGATAGNVGVTVGGQASNGVSFTVTVPPGITRLSPTSGPVGTVVTITGTSFGATQGTSTIKFNGTTATPTSWSATNIVVPVPTGATTGNVGVTVGGLASNGVPFTVKVPPGAPKGLKIGG